MVHLIILPGCLTHQRQPPAVAHQPVSAAHHLFPAIGLTLIEQAVGS